MRGLSKLVLFALIAFVLLSTPVWAATATATWIAPTTNTDGTSLTDLAGYKFYWGSASGVYNAPVDVGNVLTYTLDVGPQDGTTIYAVITAYDTSGNESAYSNEASKVFPMLVPAAPAGLTLQ